MSKPFTPNTEQAKRMYIRGAQEASVASDAEHEAEWDRWLRNHNRALEKRLLKRLHLNRT